MHIDTSVLVFNDGQEDLVRQRITYPSRREELVPFILREKNLLAFHDLRTANNPFAAVIDFQTVEMIRATDLWRDAEGKRRYITLLNRALYKYTSRLAIRYDPAHYRFYFPIEEKGRERIVQYRSLEGRRSKRKVAWQPKQKSTGEPRKFWWHLAVALRFQQMSDTQWCLSVRPERHLTSDGETPLPPNQIGRRVTRLKARMYFEQALSKVKQYDLLALFPTSEVRLVRAGRYPPLRGTAFRVGDVSYLYTSGYLATLGGYPHGHVPSPLQIADHVGDTSRAQLLREIMVLTKMNWNSANFSGLMPITLRFSRLVGNILREVPAGETPQPKYKYYM